jgi:hypothetical protein
VKIPINQLTNPASLWVLRMLGLKIKINNGFDVPLHTCRIRPDLVPTSLVGKL